ncbi:MAG: glycosyltransferase family 2 protein [Methyloprofundus sp.]|nr:glycosyltransferase family 2 protein [Methyloprofundus sp.]
MIDFCIITVTYNNSKYIDYLIECVNNSVQSSTFHVFILDNCSKDVDIIEEICVKNSHVTLIKSDTNVGFCKGNNVALKSALKLEPKAILFLNPDLFLTDLWLDKTKTILNDNSIGILSGPLLHFDFEFKKPTGLIDSLGINVTRYGKWFDVSQGRPFFKNSEPAFPKAICGALMLIPREVIDILLKTDGYVFNEKFFMYKEDVDLSLRIQKLGYKVLVHPDLEVFHCRGWKKDRSAMPFMAKKLSAINDVRVALRHRLINLPFALLKLFYVYTAELPLREFYTSIKKL